MTTNNQQEAVKCGTCGMRQGAMCACGFPLHRIRSHRYAGSSEPEGDPHHPFISAPVVPSDDALCDECGHVLTWGCHGPAQDRLISILGGELEFPHPFHAPGTGGMYADKRKAAAPPIPSQDAEGDGWRKKREDGDFGVWADFYQGRPISPFYVVPHGVESSIRDPYEELVKAARDARSALVLLTSELSGQIGYIEGLQQRPHGQPQRAIDCAHETGARVSAALTRIEEFLGGRKDG